MKKHHILFVLFGTLFISPVLQAQERLSLESLNDRLSRIERVLDQSLLEQLQRVDALQREIRTLRGELESVTYELNTLRRRNADLYADTDSRITALEEFRENSSIGESESALPTGDLSGALGDETVSLLDETSEILSSADSQPVIISPGQPAVATAGVVVNIADFGDGPKPPTTALRESATSAEKQGYTNAYDLLARGQMPEATQAFENFLKQYPEGPFSDKAWYWLGEAYYAEQNFDVALRNFGVVINSFPSSPKVPDARLKIGFSLYENREYGRAREILTRVQDDYPGRSASVLARKRLQEMDRNGQ